MCLFVYRSSCFSWLACFLELGTQASTLKHITRFMTVYEWFILGSAPCPGACKMIDNLERSLHHTGVCVLRVTVGLLSYAKDCKRCMLHTAVSVTGLLGLTKWFSVTAFWLMCRKIAMYVYVHNVARHTVVVQLCQNPRQNRICWMLDCILVVHYMHRQDPPQMHLPISNEVVPIDLINRFSYTSAL